MPPIESDVLIVGDFRFPGGTSTAVAAEIRALAGAGYRILLLSMAVPFLARRRAFHPQISSLIESGAASLAPPESAIRTRLACLHHPAVFERHSAHPLRIEAEEALLVAHHPPLDAVGTPQYDIAAIRAVTRALFDGEVPWAPVGPKVRAALGRVTDRPPLTPEDWVGIIEAPGRTARRDGPRGGLPVIGRHSRPERVKWPDTREAFLAAYPDAADIRVRLMGFGPDLEAVIGEIPRTWDVLRFGAMPVPRFLSTIDYFSYFHGSAWVEGFGRAILEAMAAGLPCLLPADFEPLFGEGALYCEAAEVAGKVRALHASPADYARQSEQAVAVLRERFSPEVAVRRVADRIGPPAASGCRAPEIGPAHRRPRVLYVTSNGVGMGHLTRALAVARRHRERAEPVIVTMSRAFGVVRDEGIMAEYIPFFRGTGMDQARWHPNLRAELVEMLRFFRPRVVVLDGNVPYAGLLEALERFPDIWSVWQRRAMWPPGVGEGFLSKQESFDAVIEPGELAAAFDRGPTRRFRGKALQVAPMTYLRPDEALGRHAARVVLGLDPDRPAVFLQLGAGNNMRTRELRRQMIEALLAAGGAAPPQIVLGRWQIGSDDEDDPDDVTVLRSFPFARFLNAFDFGIAMAGYNTFHENLAGGLPTLFLSNEHHEQDEQWLRADYARIRGLALAARTANDYDILRALREIGRPERQAALRRACGRLPSANGADEVASYLSDLAHTGRPHPAEAEF